jgi:UDP-N-acetylglucosamine 2-epimerase (non-hydrolysing)
MVMNVVGARPQFIKAGPVSRVLAAEGIEELLVHTGQHYDDLMSDAIMADVGLRQADFNLGVGSGSHAMQTAHMLEGLENLIIDHSPGVVLTYGDTNSTIAAALAATKLGVFTAHVEAGLRSFNREMPEELNRIATDHLSDLLLAPTETAMSHLANEGLANRSVKTGDVMVDALLSLPLDSVELPSWAAGEFYAATIHRPSNTDERSRLVSILDAFGRLEHPVNLIAHPRLIKSIEAFGIKEIPATVIVRDPLPYSRMVATVSASRGLLTDSGGLQKEAFVLRVPCTTIREETEWTETLEGDWNVLAGSRLSELNTLVRRFPRPLSSQPYGSGDAAKLIVARLAEHL